MLRRGRGDKSLDGKIWQIEWIPTECNEGVFQIEFGQSYHHAPLNETPKCAKRFSHSQKGRLAGQKKFERYSQRIALEHPTKHKTSKNCYLRCFKLASATRCQKKRKHQ